jgi:hypothetical protein
MTKPVANPRRLWQLSPDEDAWKLAQVFRHARAASPGALPRLHWRGRHTLRQRATRPRRLLRIALTVGLLFVAGGSVTAALHPYWHRAAPVERTKVEPPKPMPERARRRAAPEVAASEQVSLPAPPDPVVAAPTVAVVPTAKPMAVRRLARQTAAEPALAPPPMVVAPIAPPAPPVVLQAPAAPAPSPVAVEQSLLAGALKALRQQGDPRAALAMLDDHARRFPNSVLGHEASMLRAEALLGVGRNLEALSVMDHLVLTTLPNRQERLVVRGELRAAAGRWRDARSDFDAVLADSSGSGMHRRDAEERALWGRASTRSHVGDEVGAREDLALYLRLFPAGRFAAQAASSLKGSR